MSLKSSKIWNCRACRAKQVNKAIFKKMCSLSVVGLADREMTSLVTVTGEILKASFCSYIIIMNRKLRCAVWFTKPEDSSPPIQLRKVNF